MKNKNYSLHENDGSGDCLFIVIRDAYAELNQALPFPLDQGDPCSSFQIPSYRARQDISDVVPANVITALEVRSSLNLMSKYTFFKK